MPSPEQVLALRYTRRHNRILVATSTAIARAWSSLAALDDGAATRFATAAATLSRAAQTETAASLDGYLALLLGSQPLGLNPDDLTGAAVRSGAEPFDVYLRPIVAARVKVSDGMSFSDAMEFGRSSAISTAQTDVALTQRAAMASASQQTGIVGYRRVLTGKSCGICATASTQRYRTGTLMPIHNRCDCGVAPIIGSKDPGQVINQQLLKDLKNAERSATEAQRRHLAVDKDGTIHLPDIAVHEHGELGPVLTDASHDFAELGAPSAA